MITIDKIILNIQEELNKDILLKIFYENNLLNIIGMTYNEYIKKKYIEFEENFTPDKIKQFKTLILGRIRQTRSRLNRELEVYYSKSTRIIEFHNLLNKQSIHIKNNFDNELLKCICDLFLSNKIKLNNESEFITRIDNYANAFTVNGKQIMLNISNPEITQDNEKIYLSDNPINKDTTSTFIEGFNATAIDENDIIENSIIKNEISYIPIKGLNARSLKFLDKVIYDYTKTMFSKDRNDYADYKLRDLAKFLYPNNNIAMGEKLARKLITKIGGMRYKIPNPNSENINDFVIFSMFDAVWNTNEKDETYCRIYVSGFIKDEIKSNRTTKLYKEKYNLSKDDFTLIFVNFIQRCRIFDLQMLKTENIFGYDRLYEEVRLPYINRNRKKNMLAVKKSLQELKDLNFLIKDFKANDFYIEVEYLPFTNKELTEFNIKDIDLLK